MRTSDLQLLGLALGAGAAVAALALRLGRPRLGAGAVGAALLLAAWFDRRLVHAVPEDVRLTLGPWWVGLGAAVAVGWGARRLPPSTPPVPPLVLLLAGASLVGVWVGVPETSAALLGVGVLGGIGVVALARRATLTPTAAVLVALVPVAAAVMGAVGNTHALVGGLLCSTTIVLLGLHPPSAPIQLGPAIAGTAAHLASALVAARHVGVAREWSGSVLWIAVSVALAAVAATILRRKGERPG